MAKSRHSITIVVFLAVALIAMGGACTSMTDRSKLRAGSEIIPVERWRWIDPDAESVWERTIQDSNRHSLQSRMNNAGEITSAEGQLEGFGTRYMPNAYARYQDERAKAMELEQLLKEHCPKGKASDPTGGAVFAKANKKLAEAVARTFRRRDELCFFLLFHQAGIFSEDELAEYDARPISIHLEGESPDWPDDTPKADTSLPGEDATFAARYLPDTYAGYQRLCELFDEGAKQYAELRQTALALDAPRARNELAVFKNRLVGIQSLLTELKKDFSVRRVSYSLGEANVGNLTDWDQAKAVTIQELNRGMGVKTYVSRAAKRWSVALPGGAEMEMVWCPPGIFMMGSPKDEQGRDNDETLHQVTLTKGFWMAKTEVTQAQWKSVMGNNPSNNRGGKLPVENVSWNDCQQFCQKTGLSLPTEAEWEYACRAGSTRAYGGTVRLENMGWYDVNSREETHPVGQKMPNAWGLCDMHGNVGEWCADWYGAYPGGAVTNPTGASSGRGRVFRGGGFGDNEQVCRSAMRIANYPDHKQLCLGFRPIARQN